jgi:predicted small lipoprotein YifL
MRALLPLIILASLLAGCGYKGPLYLPKDKPGAQKPPAPAPAPPVEQKAPE